MAKTRRKISEDLKLVDIVAEIVDARIPGSSANPVLRDIVKSKPKLMLLNKSDVADPRQTDKWVQIIKDRDGVAVPIDAKNGKGLPAFYAAVRELMKPQIEAWTKKGLIGRPIRIMVVGIPNVGKSSLINRMIIGSGAGKAEVRDKPGVTRQNRWFTIKKGFELLDTPGVLWPKFEDPEVGRLLAYTGAVKDEILDIQGLAYGLLGKIMELYPDAVNTRFKTELSPDMPGNRLLLEIGKKRGMLITGGAVDTERAAVMVLDEFRGGKLGRITLEQVK